MTHDEIAKLIPDKVVEAAAGGHNKRTERPGGRR